MFWIGYTHLRRIYVDRHRYWLKSKSSTTRWFRLSYLSQTANYISIFISIIELKGTLINKLASILSLPQLILILLVSILCTQWYKTFCDINRNYKAGYDRLRSKIMLCELDINPTAIDLWPTSKFYIKNYILTGN